MEMDDTDDRNISVMLRFSVFLRIVNAGFSDFDNLPFKKGKFCGSVSVWSVALS